MKARTRKAKSTGESQLTGRRRATGPSKTKTLISPSAIGPANRGRVLQALIDLGPSSRAELARHTAVNRTTISGIVQPLLDQGILVAGAPLAMKRGGKPARPLWFSPQAGPICAAVLMPGVARTALVSLTGDIYAEHHEALDVDSASPEPLFDGLVRSLERTLGAAPSRPLGVGVAVGGMINTESNTIVTVNQATALAGFPLGRRLTGQTGLSVCIDHYPRAMLLGERWFGIGRGLRNFATIYTGESLGAALFLDGHLYRGPGGGGGELGHTFVQIDGDLCDCGRRGCWETIATLGWLRLEARAAGIDDPDTINSARLTAMTVGGDAVAAELHDRFAHNIAIGIANLHQTMSLSVYVLCGDVAGGGGALRDAIATHVRAMSPDRPGYPLDFRLGDIEDRATLRGAAGLILSENLQFTL
ncbi:MAG: ROK family protein [Hyphomicrobiales bacterium]|nr:ROK family protein [Hyphomicrobiales bacterium]